MGERTSVMLRRFLDVADVLRDRGWMTAECVHARYEYDIGGTVSQRTIRRHLASLVEVGLVEKQGGEYRLTGRFEL